MSHISRTFGPIPGVPLFARFKSREELMRAGVHGQSQAGIHGDSKEGAFSICISEGYEDNVDRGDSITYVGSGGQNSRGEQVENQSFEDSRNKSLKISQEKGQPVRVIRGKNQKSFWAPSSGYRYDGLYIVQSAEEKVGKQGRTMCFFELKRLAAPGDPSLPARRLLTAKKMSNMMKAASRRK